MLSWLWGIFLLLHNQLLNYLLQDALQQWSVLFVDHIVVSSDSLWRLASFRIGYEQSLCRLPPSAVLGSWRVQHHTAPHRTLLSLDAMQEVLDFLRLPDQMATIDMTIGGLQNLFGLRFVVIDAGKVGVALLKRGGSVHLSLGLSF